MRIEALREETHGKSYQNASCFRTNCMRYLPNYFYKGQVALLFHISLLIVLARKDFFLLS